ncbi:hypothetical protein WJX73_005434 [Symbiochloris irregularis]|uniref:UMP kinase n=1 Tax=Symbiochloris irregularis TaxID=706552 RepID=A0AAW1NYQ7_9CHLO
MQNDGLKRPALSLVPGRCCRLKACPARSALEDTHPLEFPTFDNVRGQDTLVTEPSSTSGRVPYRRVLLKLSGEALQGSLGFGVDYTVLESVAKEIAAAVLKGIQIAVVVGGGNYFRGASAWEGLERASADYVGMLATCMNAMLLQGALERIGVETRVQTSIEMREIAEPYIRRRAIRHLERGRVVIFGGGTGNPFFTTDTAAALRAAEIDADAFFKATKVDGVFDCDPVKNPAAILHRQLCYRDVMHYGLQVMDETAITLCKENDIPVIVFNVCTPGNIVRAFAGDPEGCSAACRHLL